jgi:hypothetical protein
MCEGYLQRPDTKKFVEYVTRRKFSIHYIHTSGHADSGALKQMVATINPKHIVPIHTFSGSAHHKTFTTPIVELSDGFIHNAAVDITATVKCFWELRRIGKIYRQHENECFFLQNRLKQTR